MGQGTVDDLKKLREELVKRRAQEAYAIRGAHNDERIMKLAAVQKAIETLDIVISEGADEPQIDPNAFIA